MAALTPRAGYQVLVFLVCLIGGEIKVILYSLGIKQEFNVASQNMLILPVLYN